MNTALAQLLAEYAQPEPNDAASGSTWFDRLPRASQAQPMERESPWMPVEIEQGQRERSFNPDAASDYPWPWQGDPAFRQLMQHYR